MQPSAITFRPATVKDLPELLTFPQSQEELFYFFPSAQYPLTLKQLQKQLSERHQSTVILKDNVVIGFANFYNVKNHKIAFIGNVIIKKEERRNGYAGQLLKHMLELGFKKLSLKEIHLSCFSQNTNALLFYYQLGFTPYAWEQREGYNKQAVIMLHLRLKNPY